MPEAAELKLIRLLIELERERSLAALRPLLKRQVKLLKKAKGKNA